MSQGPGRAQRTILDALAGSGSTGVLISDPRLTHSQRSSYLRAAKRLEEGGRLQLSAVRVDGVSRITAYSSDVVAPEDRKVTGLDGKSYRLPK